MFEVTGSPVILESLYFGFTKSEKSSELEDLIKAISVEGVKVSDHHKIDMCFGYAVVNVEHLDHTLEIQVSKLLGVVG